MLKRILLLAFLCIAMIHAKRGKKAKSKSNKPSARRLKKIPDFLQRKETNSLLLSGNRKNAPNHYEHQKQRIEVPYFLEAIIPILIFFWLIVSRLVTFGEVLELTRRNVKALLPKVGIRSTRWILVRNLFDSYIKKLDLHLNPLPHAIEKKRIAWFREQRWHFQCFTNARDAMNPEAEDHEGPEIDMRVTSLEHIARGNYKIELEGSQGKTNWTLSGELCLAGNKTNIVFVRTQTNTSSHNEEVILLQQGTLYGNRFGGEVCEVNMQGDSKVVGKWALSKK